MNGYFFFNKIKGRIPHCTINLNGLPLIQSEGPMGCGAVRSLWVEREEEAPGIGLRGSYNTQDRDRHSLADFTAAFSKLLLVQTQLGSLDSAQAFASLLLCRK